nr:hypothetical protein [Kitasatospora aureofaciens]
MPDLVRDDPRLFGLDEVTRVDRFEPAVRQRLGPTPLVLDEGGVVLFPVPDGAGCRERDGPARRQPAQPWPQPLDGAARDQAAHAVRDEHDLAGDDASTSATRSAAMSSTLGCTVVRPLRPKPARS